MVLPAVSVVDVGLVMVFVGVVVVGVVFPVAVVIEDVVVVEDVDGVVVVVSVVGGIMRALFVVVSALVTSDVHDAGAVNAVVVILKTGYSRTQWIETMWRQCPSLA